MAGRSLQPGQIAEAEGLLANVAEAVEDRQGLRVGLASLLQPAEVAVGYTERGQRDGPSKAPGRAQRQGGSQGLQGVGGPSNVQGEESESVQGFGLEGRVPSLPGELERLAEPLAGLVRLSQSAMELTPIDPGAGLLVEIVIRLPKGERLVEEARCFVVVPAQREGIAQPIRGQGLSGTVSEPLAQLQGLPVLADGTVEVTGVNTELAAALPDRGFEGRIAGEQGLGLDERLESRRLVEAIALEQAEAEEGLGPAPWQAEVRKPALRALVGSDAGAARHRLVTPAQRVGMGQIHLRLGPPVIRRRGPPVLGQP